MSAAAIALNRFGLGARASDAPPADPRAWLLDQFGKYEAMPATWASLPRTTQLAEGYTEFLRSLVGAANSQAMRQSFRRDARDTYQQGVAARANAALQSPAPFVERLVHFWSNHFAVSIDKLAVIPLAGAFEADAIRPHVLGRFEELVLAVVRHPAMLAFLDQANSIGPESPAAMALAARNPLRRRGLNENLAREIMELHTLGVRSGYTQDDVTEFARALTGFSIPGGPGARGMPGASRDGFEFRPAIHEPGARTVLGRTYTQQGEAQALAILHDLAHAPATAHHIALKLARHFVSDDPPTALVDHLADAFARSGGDLPTVYRALVESPLPWSPGVAKFKSPWDWSISSLRALGRDDVAGAQIAGLMAELGQPVWRPGSPAGFDDADATWAAPDALMRRVEAAGRMASRAAATTDARTLAARVLPGVVGLGTTEAIARADTPQTALALLLVSPEFMRR